MTRLADKSKSVYCPFRAKSRAQKIREANQKEMDEYLHILFKPIDKSEFLPLEDH